MRRWKTRQSHPFTLIELLVVVSIIALLAAMIMPVLGQAKVTTRRTACASSQRQCAMATMAYASDANDYLAEAMPMWESNGYFLLFGGIDYDLRRLLASYIGDWEIWRCPSVPEQLRIDDPWLTNARSKYGPFDYYPGRTCPDFGTTRRVPRTLIEAADGWDWVLMHDTLHYRLAEDYFMYNHGSGTFAKGISNVGYYWVYTVSTPIAGANVTFYDGRVEWTRFNEMTPVGDDLGCGGGTRYYSLLP